MEKINKKLYFLLALLLFFFFIPFSYSLNPIDWYQYSPQYSYTTNTQDINSNSFFNLGYITKESDWVSSGLSPPSYFPIQLTSKIIGTTNYLFIVDNDMLSVYDNNLNLLTSIFSDVKISTLALFSNDNQTIKITGIFSNGTGQYFKVFDYNTISNVLIKNTTSLLLTFGNGFKNIKCMQTGTTYFNYSGIVCLGILGVANPYRIYTFYDNGTFLNNSISALTDTCSISVGAYPQVPSLYDTNNDGVLEILGNSNDCIFLTNSSGTLLWNKEETANYVIADAILYKDTSSQLKIFYTELSTIPASTILNGRWLNLDGTTHSSVINFDSSTAKVTGYLSALDYRNLGKDDIALAYSKGQNTTIKIIDNNGNVLNEMTIPRVIYGISATYGMPYKTGSIVSAKLNGDSYYDFILEPNFINNTAFALDVKNNQVILNSTGMFYPSDMDTDGILELTGYNTTGIIILDSNYSNQNPVINAIQLSPSSNPAPNATLTAVINATDAENDYLHYYLDCGNGNIYNDTHSYTFTCVYASTGAYTLTGFVKDEFHADYISLSELINVGATPAIENGTLGSFVNPILGLFPEASSLTLGQRGLIVLIVMFITAIIILFAGSSVSDGIHVVILAILLLIEIVEFIFFISIQYIPIGFLVIILLIGAGIAFLRLKGGNG